MSTKSFQNDKNLYTPEFENLREKVDIMNKKKWFYFKKWKKIEEECNKLHTALIMLCDHKWERDYSSFDPSGTSYICNICGDTR